MKTIVKKALAAALLTLGTATAAAGTLTFQNVTFTTSWVGDVLTLEVDAANPTGDWSTAVGIAAIQLKDVGSFAGVTLAGPGAASGWAYSPNELNAGGCTGGAHVGTGLCFSGTSVALSDDMMFQFTFTGGSTDFSAPHLKLIMVDASGDKVGSLVSLPIPEPETYAMLLAGLGLLGVMARRRGGT